MATMTEAGKQVDADAADIAAHEVPQISIPKEQFQKLLATQAHDEGVRKKQKEVAKLKVAWDSARNTSLAAKKSYDEAVDELQELIEEADDPQQRLDFDAAAVTPNSKESKPHVSGPHKPWQDISIDEMDIPPGSKASLNEAGVKTLGDYDSFQRGEFADYPDGAASLKHWGSTKVSRADAAFKKVRGDAEEASGVADEEPDEPKAKVKITQATNQMIAKGLKAGTVTDAKLVGANAHVKNSDGDHVTLLKNEFLLVEDDAEIDAATEAASDESEPEEPDEPLLAEQPAVMEPATEAGPTPMLEQVLAGGEVTESEMETETNNASDWEDVEDDETDEVPAGAQGFEEPF